MAERLSTAQAIGALTAQIEAMNARLDREHQERQKLDRDAAAARGPRCISKKAAQATLGGCQNDRQRSPRDTA